MSYFEKMDGAQFESQYYDLLLIQTRLNEAYSVASQLQQQIQKNDWKGKSKNEMQAYLDLLLQYHGSLIGKAGGSNPVQEGAVALKQLLDYLDAFYSECDVFRKLESL